MGASHLEYIPLLSKACLKKTKDRSMDRVCLQPVLTPSLVIIKPSIISIQRAPFSYSSTRKNPFPSSGLPNNLKMQKSFLSEKRDFFIIILILGKVSCSLFPPLASKTTSKCRRVFCQEKRDFYYYFDIRQSQLLFRLNSDQNS